MAKALGGVLTLAALGAAAFAVWFLFLRSDAPPPVSLDQAIAGITTATPAPGSSPAAGDNSIAQPQGYDGTWVLQPADSFVGYRVREELAGIGATTAVGRTSSVEGTLEFDGTAITSVEITADLRTLRSDDSRRDGQLRRQALETERFPEGTFVLTEPVQVSRVPAEGVTISATAVGELTLHGVTQEVQVPLEGRIVGDAVVVVGSLTIEFADYDISPPTAGIVLSVEDQAVMELSLVFRRG